MEKESKAGLKRSPQFPWPFPPDPWGPPYPINDKKHRDSTKRQPYNIKVY
jgi:hypothetical protein